jgi:diacylglycerol kinase (ATP)
MRLSPGARVDDGRLEVCLIEALGKLEIVRRFPQLLRGTFPGHPKVRYFPGCELTVESATPLPLALDGDVVGVTPAQLRVLPGALCVVAPAAG